MVLRSGRLALVGGVQEQQARYTVARRFLAGRPSPSVPTTDGSKVVTATVLQGLPAPLTNPVGVWEQEVSPEDQKHDN